MNKTERDLLMSKLFYHTVTDTQWKIIEPHLPKTKNTGRPSLNPRTVFNAILWVLDSGAKWRYIPKEFGNWNSIYHKFRQWCDEKVFEKILQSLVDSCRKYYLVEMDSTFCKVHQHAAGARKIFGNQDIGTSRGGKTTKIHATVSEILCKSNLKSRRYANLKITYTKKFTLPQNYHRHHF